jgi:hypothetical protein
VDMFRWKLVTRCKPRNSGFSEPFSGSYLVLRMGQRLLSAGRIRSHPCLSTHACSAASVYAAPEADPDL